LIFRLSPLANAHEISFEFTTNLAVNYQDISQIGMLTLIKGAQKSDAWLNADKMAMPFNFHLKDALSTYVIGITARASGVAGEMCLF
jgi:hypothetical protein